MLMRTRTATRTAKATRTRTGRERRRRRRQPRRRRLRPAYCGAQHLRLLRRPRRGPRGAGRAHCTRADFATAFAAPPHRHPLSRGTPAAPAAVAAASLRAAAAAATLAAESFASWSMAASHARRAAAACATAAEACASSQTSWLLRCCCCGAVDAASVFACGYCRYTECEACFLARDGPRTSAELRAGAARRRALAPLMHGNDGFATWEARLRVCELVCAELAGRSAAPGGAAAASPAPDDEESLPSRLAALLGEGVERSKSRKRRHCILDNSRLKYNPDADGVVAQLIGLLRFAFDPESARSFRIHLLTARDERLRARVVDEACRALALAARAGSRDQAAELVARGVIRDRKSVV